ncbi:hypothetical protein [Falsiroseomonas oryzae]|uniref:hypothetical protein n=1 Tax=Falsiroseomonas oryzae TaxID=2766473 RepID=UPI0022EB2DB7|nr:hypothetical protein [Roseomonas sp. MO-31]
MELGDVFLRLGSAFEVRRAWAAAEIEAARSLNARHDLLLSHGAILACSERVTSFPGDFVVISGFLARLGDGSPASAARQRRVLDRLAAPTGRPDSIRGALARKVRAGCDGSAVQLAMVRSLGDLVQQSARALLLALLVVLSRPDAAPREAFLATLRDGLVDRFLEQLPGAAPCRTILAAVAAALRERDGGEKGALFDGERLREVLAGWATAMDAFRLALRELCAEPRGMGETRSSVA